MQRQGGIYDERLETGGYSFQKPKLDLLEREQQQASIPPYLKQAMNEAIDNESKVQFCLDEVSSAMHDYDQAEVIAVVKMVAVQMIILNARNINQKGELARIDNHTKEIIEKYKEKMLILGESYNIHRYLEYMDRPIKLQVLLIDELVDECTKTLEIDQLPDEKGTKHEERKDRKFESQWKYDILKNVLQQYNEPMLNLHFLGPYLKNSLQSIGSYDLIFQLFRVLPDAVRTEVFDVLVDQIKSLNKDIIHKNEEFYEYENKILPLYHILIHMVLNYTFQNQNQTF